MSDETDKHNTIAWSIINTYFKDNPEFVVKHHLSSYNDLFQHNIQRIFRENNPITIQKERINDTDDFKNECHLYLGGKQGTKLYYGKPIIYDNDDGKHFMYPNEARLRNMTYGFSIHYDVEVDFIFKKTNDDPLVERELDIEHQHMTISKVYLGRFPIMLHSDLCILKSLSPDVRYAMGECRNDPGGYFIVDGKEKVIVSQEKFGNNMLYVRDSVNDLYSHSAEIRSVSEDPSKPKRTLRVQMVSPTPSLSNRQIVVSVPNIRKAVPLFIVMRALGIISDRDIIQTCLLDMEINQSLIDLFIPSIHDAGIFFTQDEAIRYLATFTKGKTKETVMDILMNYFLPNIGEMNFNEKAYYLGYMVYKMLLVYTKQEMPTDRDSFTYKRVEVSGTLLYDLFVEYYKLQFNAIRTAIDKRYHYHQETYQTDFVSLINTNYDAYFGQRMVAEGIRKAFKGNWGAQAHTKRLGIVQDLNRLSYFSFLSHLRKLNLPIDSSAKVVKPRLLHSTQWGLICPVHTPDGANIGFHKHLAISAHITAGCSAAPMKLWLRRNGLRLLVESDPTYLYQHTKVFVNGTWIGIIHEPLDLVNKFKLERRNGLIPVYHSIRWNIKHNELFIYTDSGRLTRPIFYIDPTKTLSYDREHILSLLNKSDSLTWQQCINGIHKKKIPYQTTTCEIYAPDELYTITGNHITFLEHNKAIVDYVDTSESEGILIGIQPSTSEHSPYTNIEIHPSLILSIMGNMVIYPENNQLPRDLFSCGQSKQAVSLYSSNYLSRIDKMGVVLNYGQLPIVKSRYLDYVTKEQHPYGENAIVAIMCYSGYNVEDALIFNEASIQRGMFHITYYNSYESHETSTEIVGTFVDSTFCDIQNKNVKGLRPGYDYAYLDTNGIVRENTKIDDKIIVIGKCTNSLIEPGTYIDDSIKLKKGQSGFVDKSFITEGEEGKRIAKVRIRENRPPRIGDKFCSRAGQKGTIGIILPEEDMPFTADGVRPDIIVNPHALPSRMTIGHLLECLVGKACLLEGGYGDCTAFVNKGPQQKIFGDMLKKEGYHPSGNQVLYNGMTGEQLEADIFFGPNYYLRLKHMVKDKINYRARGPKTALTRQPVHGRAKDGGLRIGEMDRDAIIAHGMSKFLQESMLERSDDFYMAVCNKTGIIAIYNESQNIFLSPLADGPIQFNGTLDGNIQIENVSRFGKDFSIVRVPYAFKLLLQELQTMNINMRIITADNIDQLTSLTYDPKQVKLNTGVDTYEELLKKYQTLTRKELPAIKEPKLTLLTPILEPELDELPELGTYQDLKDIPIGMHTPPFLSEDATNIDLPPFTDAILAQSPQSPPSPHSPEIPSYYLAIIVPFRNQPLLEGEAGQDRSAHRAQFIAHMKTFNTKVSQYVFANAFISLEIDMYIIQQSDDGRKFNRGALLDVGFIQAIKSKYYHGVIMHDIDLLPNDSMIPFYAMGIFTTIGSIVSDKPVVHLAHKWNRYSSLGTGYIGGVTMFKSDFFNNINGFPTYFAGWGGEDDALRERMVTYMKGKDSPLVSSSDEEILRQIVAYPDAIPEEGYVDLEHISDYKQKRALLTKDVMLDNTEKALGRALDKKIWKYNGLVNPSKYGNLFAVKEKIQIDANMIQYNVYLNDSLTTYLTMKTEMGDLSQIAVETLDYTAKYPIVEIMQFTTPHASLTPEYRPVSPAYAPASPAYAPVSPAYAPVSPVEYQPKTPDYTATSPIQWGVPVGTHSPPETPMQFGTPVSPAYTPASPVEYQPKTPEYTAVSPEYSPTSPPEGMSSISTISETPDGVKKISVGSDIKGGGITDITDLIDANIEPNSILQVRDTPDKEEESDTTNKKIII